MSCRVSTFQSTEILVNFTLSHLQRNSSNVELRRFPELRSSSIPDTSATSATTMRNSGRRAATNTNGHFGRQLGVGGLETKEIDRSHSLKMP